MAKFKVKKTALSRRAEKLVSDGAWPFKNISKDDFIKASTPLLEMLHNVEERKIDGKKADPAAYMDRTMEATISMLKCIQKMEMEASYEEMFAMMCWHEGDPYNMAFMDANEFVEYAIEQMYEYNNAICDSLSEDLQKQGIAPRYIDMESKRNYLVDEEFGFAERAAKDHYCAIKEAYEEIDNLIKYGLPSEVMIGKIKDRIVGSADIKDNNKTIVDKILNSEADLEIVNLYILPELDLRIQEYGAKAAMEEKWTKNKEDLEFGDVQQTDPYFFRRGHEAYVKAKKSIEEALLTMQKKEIKLESNYKIEIKKDPKAGTYMLTAEWSKGNKSKKKKSENITKKVKKESNVIKEKNRKEKSIKIKIGKSSNRLYEETKTRSACKFGYENRKEIKTQKRSLSNIFSTQILRREAMLKRRTKITGQTDYDAKVSFVPAKVEDKVVYTRKKNETQNKEFTLLDAKVGLGNVSAGVSIKNNIPSAKMNASIANAGVEVLGVVKANASLGSSSYNTNINLPGQIKQSVFKQVVGDEQTDIENETKKMAQESVKKITKIVSSGPKASAEVEIGDISLLKASSSMSGSKAENNIPNIIDATKSMIEHITRNDQEHEGHQNEKESTNTNNCIEILDDAIDMQIFDVDLSKFAVLDQQPAQNDQSEEMDIVYDR